MTAIVTDKFRFNNLRRTKKRLDEEIDRVFLGIGKSESWPSDSLPPDPAVDPYSEIETRHGLQALKKVSDIAFAAPRYNWTAGATYVAWNDADPDLHTKKYFVINPTNFNVYLCLKAGSGASTVEPIGLDDDGSGQDVDKGSVTPTAKADGYIWKYLYTITAVESTKFLTNDFIPVKRDPNVAANAIKGQMFSARIVSPGSGYASAPTVTVIGNGTGAQATAIISGGEVIDVQFTNPGSGYTYATLVLSGGSPSTPASVKPVIAPFYEGREIKSISVVSGGTSYANGSINIKITGDGYGAVATGTATGGVIQNSITVSNGGYGYTEVAVEPEKTTNGDAAVLDVALSDFVGGFGYDPIVDLNAYYLMFNVLLEGDENPIEGFQGDFIPGNNYRQLVLINNPTDLATDKKLFTDTTGLALNHHVVVASGTWVQDDVITGGSSGAKAIVDYYDANTEKLYYHQNESTGFTQFTAGENLTGVGLSSGQIAAGASNVNQKGEVDRYSGTLLYLENRPPVSRAIDQTEDIKLVIQF